MREVTTRLGKGQERRCGGTHGEEEGEREGRAWTFGTFPSLQRPHHRTRTCREALNINQRRSLWSRVETLLLTRTTPRPRPLLPSVLSQRTFTNPGQTEVQSTDLLSSHPHLRRPRRPSQLPPRPHLHPQQPSLSSTRSHPSSTASPTSSGLRRRRTQEAWHRCRRPRR
ncbi:hypothetical protein BDY24DRAFT_382473 [Mrakia frigida]|uniref:uncharacterized protein n=1 Tax=Mrakia frigida TaxID=29902 RepID=UPI003FCC1B30